jgi:hypothetical protein
MTRALFEVVPVDGGWLVRMPGDSVSELRGGKSEAIQRARELGRQYDAWRVRVLTASGSLESELSSAPSPPAS